MSDQIDAKLVQALIFRLTDMAAIVHAESEGHDHDIRFVECDGIVCRNNERIINRVQKEIDRAIAKRNLALEFLRTVSVGDCSYEALQTMADELIAKLRGVSKWK